VADRPAPVGSKAPPTPRTAAELQQIETLVRSAVGADSARGDLVSVVSVPFAPVAVVTPEVHKTDITQIIQTTQRPLLGILGLVLIIVIAMISLKSLKGGSATAPANSPALALPRHDGGSHASMIGAGPLVPVVLPTNTMRDKVNSTIEQQPDVAARVVRAWLKEA
jgi:flagellar M-ring protein FliF